MERKIVIVSGRSVTGTWGKLSGKAGRAGKKSRGEGMYPDNKGGNYQEEKDRSLGGGKFGTGESGRKGNPEGKPPENIIGGKLLRTSVHTLHLNRGKVTLKRNRGGEKIDETGARKYTSSSPASPPEKKGDVHDKLTGLQNPKKPKKI